MNTSEPHSTGRRRVLVVDDDARQLKLSRLRLQAAGFDVETAADAAEALLLLGRRKPDAILSDVLMGEVDGFGFCRRVREDSSLDHVPVILLSAHYDEDADRDLAHRIGATELVRRTPTFDAELAALQRSLEARSSASVAPAERATYEQHLRTNAHQLSKLLSQAKRAEERYRRLLEHAHDAIMITRLDGTIVEANGRWRDILGVPIEELIGRCLHDFSAGRSRKTATSIRPVLESGAGTIGPLAFEARDGRIVQMVLSMSVVEVEEEQLVLSIGNDVTATLEASRAAALVEERYRLLVERMPDVIWTKSAAESSTFFTPNAEKLFGEPLATLSAAGVSVRLARVHPDDSAALQQAFATYVESGTPFDVEYRYRRKDGRWIWLRERSFAMTERDGALVGEGMISDVTERKRLEDDLRQSHKLEALGQLTGGIAHDFNNILATILANAQFLIEALPEGDPRRSDAEAVRDGGERAANLTRQLLAFSRRQVLEPRVIDLNAAVSSVQRMLRSIIRENIAFTFIPADDVGAVKIDIGQLEQVIMNLVVNACDAMPAGGVLTIETANDKESDRVLLRVRDTGHGIDPATQRRIFEPFFTTKEKGHGTGLGLATCYGIVQQSGGRIAVESEVGSGTTFTIALPRVDERPSASQRQELAPAALGDGETILLVEDDSAVRAVVKRLFERAGYRVLTAQNATDAMTLGLAPDVRFDLVVSDIILPGATGPHVVNRIRAKRPGLKALFVSGYNDPQSLAGADISNLRIIEKPFKPDRLLHAVRAELAR